MNNDNKQAPGGMKTGDAAFIFFIAATAVVLSIFVSVFIPVSKHAAENREVYITYGSGLKKISYVLKSEGMIRNRFAFELYSIVTMSNRKFQAGEYEFSPSISVAEMVAKLVKGDVKKHRIVIPEGSDIVDIDRIFAGAGMIEAGYIKAAAQDRPFLQSMGLDKRGAEGFLFPDTYYVIRGETAKKIVKTMYERFRQKAPIDLDRTYEIQGYKVSGYKVLIMASIIEKESRLDTERFLVSSVFYNRLRSPEMYQKKLESCATVRYALNKKKGIITYRDLRVDNPYNTYIRIGLPPGPICNPGLESIQAALQPAVTNYKYFVLFENGEHTFSETLGQHNRAKAANKIIRAEQE